jgi:hypothetical protein
MSTQSLHKSLFPSAFRAAFAAGALLALSVPTLLAAVPSPKLAAAAASGTIGALIAADDPNFASDAAMAIDQLADADLTAADDTAIVKAALGTISDAIAGGSSPLSAATLLAGDQAIGAALAADPTLEGLNAAKNGLVTVLQGGIAGITGVRGKSQIAAPEAAGAFVAGLVSGPVPDNLALPTFAVDILKGVSKNTSVDELVAYQIGLKDNATQADLVTLATTLFAKYPSAINKVGQGILAVTPAGFNTEANRVTFVNSLTMAVVKDAVAITQGAIFVDPYYADKLTQGVINGILAAPAPTGGTKGAIKYATKIATIAGQTLGQDGQELTDVASVFSALTGADTLPVASSSVYALALINGAIKGLPATVPTSVFPPTVPGGDPVGVGGKLAVKTGISNQTVMDLESIVDLFANGIISANGTSAAAGIAADVKEIGALIKGVAALTKSETFLNSNSVSVPVAVYLAGSLTDTIATLTGATGTAWTDLEAAIAKGVDAEVTKTVKAVVTTDVFTGTAYTNYPEIGAIAVQETTVTNL